MTGRKLIPCVAKKAENIAVAMFFVAFILFGAINLLDKRTALLATGSVWYDSLIAFGIFVVGLVVHEGLHALCAILIGKLKPTDVRFGIDLCNLNLYTHFSAPIKRNAYLVAVILPCLTVGLIPMAIVTAFGSPILLAAVCLLFAGSAGDIAVFFSVLKQDHSALIVDHPNALAYYLTYPSDVCPQGFTPTSQEEEEAMLKATQGDKQVTKKSLLLKCLGIMAFIALYVLMMYLIGLIMKNF